MMHSKENVSVWNSMPAWLTFMRISYSFLRILSSIKSKLSKGKQMTYTVIYWYRVGGAQGIENTLKY